ncbi:cytochrome P450 [Infundibulicybe gibba]|nr:cytochrome P450 [Infundibulicybe gibba]
MALTHKFEKRSALYSSRPRYPMINELMRWAWLFAFMPYGDYWRSHRRLFHQEFHPTAAIRYQPQEMRVTREMLQRLLDTPDDFMIHLRHMAGAITMSIGYGINVLPENDPYIYTAEKAIYGLVEAAVPGTFLVDSIPLLKYVPEWMPGASFKRKAREWHEHATKMIEAPFAVIQRTIACGVAPEPSFISYCLANIDKTGDIEYQERIIQETAANLYTAGSDTTVSALNTFVLAMVCFPQAQAKAQEELDRVLAPGHLPDFDDEASLPYLAALVKEVLRWQPVTPIAIPHYLGTDDIYKGYRLPADSVVIGNAWSAESQREMYPDPHNFYPDRFLKDGKLDPNIRDPTAVFGFGRRLCPGRHMAISSLWIAAASILATFSLEKAIDEDGYMIEPSQEYHSALICHPLPFKCTIKPRSRETEALVRS